MWLSVTGTTADALARDPLALSLCGPDASGLTLGPGTHTLISAPGQDVGFDVDELALASAPGGAATAVLPGGQLPPPATATVGTTTVVHETATKATVEISGISATTAPFEFVLGQSINAGWTATAGGHDLGAPMLVDAFANGWRVDPATVAGAIHDGTLTVTLAWAPQRSVDIALLISALVVVLCVVLALVPGGGAAGGVGRGRRATPTRRTTASTTDRRPGTHRSWPQRAMRACGRRRGPRRCSAASSTAVCRPTSRRR